MPNPEVAASAGPISAPYGTWASPVTSHIVAAGSVRLGSLGLDEDAIYWLEGRPNEAGRQAIVKRTADGQTADVTPPHANVRTRVQEYGGASYVVSQGIIYYSEFEDQRLYRLAPGREPEPLTPPEEFYYADASIDPVRERLVCVREDHTVAGREAVTTLVSVPRAGPLSAGQIIASGHDFYSTPRFSPDGSSLSWIAWRHPQMPWDGTELWMADITPDGTLARARLVAGSERESIGQAEWTPDGTLYFLSDRTGWWNLYRWIGGRIEAVLPMSADFGRPPWQLGTRTWACAGPSRLVVSFAQQGRWRLATIDLPTGDFRLVPTDVEPADMVAATPAQAVIIAGSSSAPDAVIRVDFETGALERLRTASAAMIDEEISLPQAIEFPTEAGVTAHGFYYPPRNPRFVAPAGERPPLIVVSHGGPTAAASARLNLEIQFWTSRGFAVVDVNYGGSAGYGRAYRERLTGQWGIVDVADCVNAAKYLVARGDADSDRLIIRGRSAGGYTTLAALAFRPEVFHAGASYFGVADLELLVRDTHKFESRYLDSLVGPYPAARDTYLARSPIHHVDQVSCPVIFFQGLEDRIVPPNQSRLMAEAVRAKGLAVELVMLEGEQHGFRRADSIRRCLESELAFYGSVFGFSPAHDSQD